ncbi:MAG: fasciclin domain-containing protein [Spirochaetaceae bacterium]|nr:MAG: fasciclin domain-containing protein [Spirochaetaceae bacterium]
MRIRDMIITALLCVIAAAPLAAHGAPPEADYPELLYRDSAVEAVSKHDQTTIAYAVFGDEFGEITERVSRHQAYFVPADEALADWDDEGLANEELGALAERHIATGPVAEQPLEYVESFTTLDGETISVAIDDRGRPLLNGEVTVVESIRLAYGYMHIIDGRLDG